MSLYDNAPAGSNIKDIVTFGKRPIWLSIGLVLTILLAISALSNTIIHLTRVGDDFKYLYKTEFIVNIGINVMLIILSTIYLFKPITLLGLLSATIWLASLIMISLVNFDILNIDTAIYLIIEPFWLNSGGFIFSILSTLYPICIFLFSIYKYRDLPKI